MSGYPVCRIAFEKHLVDQTDDLCLVLHNLRQLIFAFFVAKEILIGQAELAISELLPLSPGNVGRKAAAFLLAKLP